MILMFLLLTMLVSKTNCWYQDCVINGTIVEKGERNGLPTYQVIKKIFDLYQRPFTVLDIGAAQGFFSFMTAYDYEATCVMVEGDYDYQNHTTKLCELCEKNTELDKIIFLKKLVDLDFLKNLSDCEHFDVTLALNFVHHSGLDWQKTIDFLVEMGDNLILENPPHNELNITQLDVHMRKNIDLYMEKLGAVVIGEVETNRVSKNLIKSKIWWLHKPKKRLKRRHIYWPPPSHMNYIDDGKYHLINSDFTKKELIKKIDPVEIKSPWINGINMVTFLSFNGAYPTKELILSEVDRLKTEQVHDWGLANMILTGNKITLIDRQDFACQAAYKNLADFIYSKIPLNSVIYWHLNQNLPDINKILYLHKKITASTYRKKQALRYKIININIAQKHKCLCQKNT